MKTNKYSEALLSIYDSLKLVDTAGELPSKETLTGIMFRKLKAYDIDLNKELGFTHLKPYTLKDRQRQLLADMIADDEKDGFYDLDVDEFYNL